MTSRSHQAVHPARRIVSTVEAKLNRTNSLVTGGRQERERARPRGGGLLTLLGCTFSRVSTSHLVAAVR